MSEREFRLPDLGEGLTESEIVAWRVAEGDTVALNQVIAEVETAKALVELPSPVAGTVRTLHAEPGQTVNVGQAIVTFDVDAPAVEPVEPNLVGYGAKADSSSRPARRRRAAADGVAVPRPPVRPAPQPRADVVAERPRSTPPVRFLAAQLGIDLERLTGTGDSGLITRDDVLAASTRSSGVGGEEIRVPIRGVRKATAAAMVESAFTAPHVTVFHTTDVTTTLELATRLSTDEGRVSLLAMVSRAVCLGIAAHPELNSRWDEQAQEIVIFGGVNLGIAAATERGLVVPNIKGAERLTVPELSAELRALALEARAGRAAPERLSGGTFTISNIGVFGVEAGTPILNPGEAAILALGAVQRRPWEHHGGIALRDVVTLSLSFDHRVIDGEQGSRFLASVGRMLAEPVGVLA